MSPLPGSPPPATENRKASAAGCSRTTDAAAVRAVARPAAHCAVARQAGLSAAGCSCLLEGRLPRRPGCWHQINIMKKNIICYCLNVSEEEIIHAIRTGAKTLKDIQKATKACTGNQCKQLNPSGKCCSTDILKIIKNETGTAPDTGCCCE